MNDPDVLTRAAKALRAAHTGEREGSGFTRARIMTTLHGKRRRQLLRWAVLSPLASLVLVGSAWAHSTGKWPAVWRAVTSVLVASPQPPSPPPSPSSQRPPEHVEPRPLQRSDSAELPPPEQRATAPEGAPSPAPAPSRTLETEPADSPSRARAGRRMEPPGAQARGAGPPIEESKPSSDPVGGRAPADPELSKFRRAHDLHFRTGRPREAIAAYAAYLEEFPNGRFVPEARYNTALNWIKLGDKAAARAALAPFAAGVHGEYRRAEARQLLEALK